MLCLQGCVRGVQGIIPSSHWTARNALTQENQARAVGVEVPEEEMLVGQGVFQAWAHFCLISCWWLGPPTVQAGLKSASCAPSPRGLAGLFCTRGRMVVSSCLPGICGSHRPDPPCLLSSLWLAIHCSLCPLLPPNHLLNLLPPPSPQPALSWPITSLPCVSPYHLPSSYSQKGLPDVNSLLLSLHVSLSPLA